MCKKLFILTSFVLVFGLVGNAIGQPAGHILFEYWMDIGGGAVADLTGQADYPDNPDDAELRTSLDGKVDWADNYGLRVTGYLYPPEDGDYTFWIAGDDFQDLYLSTDADPANAVLLAQVPGWTGHLAWSNYPEQQSTPITLAAGGEYYIEVIMKEGGGGDSCAVGWTGPGIGEEITVIDGAYLAPSSYPPMVMKAKNPDPADGAVDADVATLGWESGALAVSHVVYLNGELLAETDQNFAAADLAPGTANTWQVDEVLEDGTVTAGDVWSFTTLPLEAHFPSPADGAEDVASPVTLTWTVGKNTIINDVYFGADEALVAARDMSTFKGKLMTPSYAAGDVELFSTYYWAVDEFTPGGTIAGPVWSFSTEKYVAILTGEQTLAYDNSAEPYVSELALDTPADLTFVGAVSDLTLSFQGAGPPPPPEGSASVDEATGTYTIVGSGADVWGGSDQFHYGYMNLTGDGEISARVVSNGTGSNNWAKGGVMIRETTAGNSAQMLMGMTGGDGGGIAFQGRSETGSGTSTSFHGTVIAEPPYWVKLTREGNAITAYASADGETWDQFTCDAPDGAHTNPMEVVLPETVLIGLFVTSHAAGEARTYTFDNVDIQGDVDGVIVNEDIGIVAVGNTPAPIYLALEDAAGAVAVVPHPYAEATMIEGQRGWRIPLDEFAGVDPTAAAKLYIGVGDGEPGGTGSITVSDIRVVEPVAMVDVTGTGDIVQGVPNDGLMDGDNWGWPGGEPPAYAVDDNVGTKFLHFRGELMPTGIQVTPLNGPSVVTGLTLTTANDASERDPISFELAGSNVGICGPYELIASGDVADFAGEEAWPRFTKNATSITFSNDVEYAHYQLLFLDIRDPDGSNSMQIAEVELLQSTGAVAEVEPENLLANGGFEDGVMDPWTTYGDVTTEVVSEGAIEGDYCLHVVVPAAGANSWDAGLQNAGHVFEAGKNYTLSASLKSNAGELQVHFKPEIAADPWSGYGDTTMTITEEWAEYSVTTGVFETDIEPASITFHIAFTAGDFLIDDVKFIEVE